MTLDPLQIRVLGALIEKEIATPEGYPLSLNALVNACNQRSSRDPVMDLTEEQVRQALHSLEDLGLTATVRDSRVAKYEHRIRTILNLRRDETAILCLLFLRGPQTPGELRSRAGRLYSFDGLDAVESTLERLAARPTTATVEGLAGALDTGPLAVMLPRQPGSREARYAHLLGRPGELGGPDELIEATARNPSPARPRSRSVMEIDQDSEPAATTADRLIELEAEVASLRSLVTSFETRLSEAEKSLSRRLPE